MQQCPKCQSPSIHRSHTRNVLETWRKSFTTKRPHRCQRCGWRGWGEESTPKFDADSVRRSEEAIVPGPADVDLKKL